MPENVVLCSWPPGEPAWTPKRVPVPYQSRFGPLALDPDALIPVEAIACRLVLVGAGQDRIWLSAAMAQTMFARRRGRMRGRMVLELIRQVPESLPVAS